MEIDSPIAIGSVESMRCEIVIVDVQVVCARVVAVGGRKGVECGVLYSMVNGSGDGSHYCRMTGSEQGISYLLGSWIAGSTR